jgi:hypothetical protein
MENLLKGFFPPLGIRWKYRGARSNVSEMAEKGDRKKGIAEPGTGSIPA